MCTQRGRRVSQFGNPECRPLSQESLAVGCCCPGPVTGSRGGDRCSQRSFICVFSLCPSIESPRHPLNLRGEAIVRTLTEAVRTSLSSGMDALVIGCYLVAKQPDDLGTVICLNSSCSAKGTPLKNNENSPNVI
jgi:hypothetical protein